MEKKLSELKVGDRVSWKGDEVVIKRYEKSPSGRYTYVFLVHDQGFYFKAAGSDKVKIIN